MFFRFLLFSTVLLSTLLPARCQGDQEYIFPSPGDYPVLKQAGKKAEDFVPRGWTVQARAEGDLNGDGIDDCVMAVKGESEKFKVRDRDKLGVDLFDTNPRILIVLFGGKDAFGLATASKTIVPIPDTPLMEEPLRELVVKKGILELEVQEYYNAGSGGWACLDMSSAIKTEPSISSVPIPPISIVAAASRSTSATISFPGRHR